VHFSEVRDRRFCCLFVYLSSLFSKSRRNDLRRIKGPSLETDEIFDAVLSVNYCAIGDCVSVMRVQEMVDEKGRS
jgi:hypothetical protein